MFSSLAPRRSMDIRNYMIGPCNWRDCQLAKDYDSINNQLLKDLCSIPPPTPRVSGLNFLPDAGNQTFMYLVGLEEIVQERLKETQCPYPKQRNHKIKGALRKETGPPYKYPNTCNQCSTDFTGCWWCVMSTDTAKDLVCDQCKTSNDKKAITQAHTAKMEEAFRSCQADEAGGQAAGPAGSVTGVSAQSQPTGHAASASQSEDIDQCGQAQ